MEQAGLLGRRSTQGSHRSGDPDCRRGGALDGAAGHRSDRWRRRPRRPWKAPLGTQIRRGQLRGGDAGNWREAAGAGHRRLLAVLAGGLGAGCRGSGHLQQPRGRSSGERARLAAGSAREERRRARARGGWRHGRDLRGARHGGSGTMAWAPDGLGRAQRGLRGPGGWRWEERAGGRWLGFRGLHGFRGRERVAAYL